MKIPMSVLRRSKVQGGLTSESPLGRKFLDLWRGLSGRELVAEYQFLPNRKFRFDFADSSVKCAIELHGGAYTRGGHVRPKGFTRDCEKMRLAAVHGWRVFAFTAEQITEFDVAETAQAFDLAAYDKERNEKILMQVRPL